MNLLTVKEALAQLKIGRKAFMRLKLPCVLLGTRKKRYRQDDIDAFVNSRMRYPAHLDGFLEHQRRTTQRRRSVSAPFKLPTWKEAKAKAEAEAAREKEKMEKKNNPR
jgi:hypothetical protein